MKTSMRTVRIPAGQALLNEGDNSDQMYLLQSGKLSVSVMRDGNKVILGEIGINELVGELSFLDNGTRSATVVAVEDCQLIEILRDKFEEQLSSQPAWVSGLVRTLAARLREANNRIKI